MAEYGLYKNSEGYVDPTAYEAIRGMAKPGEIWTYKEREVLIVKNQGGYSNILQLGIYKKGCVDVAGRYAQPGMLSYAFNDLLTAKVEAVTDEEFAAIQEEVAEALGLTNEPKGIVAAMDERNKENFERWLKEAPVTVLEADPEKEALRAKVVLLQNMYNDLLGKVIAKVGA